MAITARIPRRRCCCGITRTRSSICFRGRPDVILGRAAQRQGFRPALHASRNDGMDGRHALAMEKPCRQDTRQQQTQGGRAMPMPSVDATTEKYLRDKYAIVGVGETDYKRGSTQTTRSMATFA